jgi:hypothetical protein
MGVIAEVRDAVKLMAELVDQTRTILSALEDGREYLQRYHPTATTQVAELMEQMRVTVAGAISVTRIVADFDFTVEGTDVDRQPARFNDHLIRVDEQIRIKEEGELHLLSGSCTQIRRLRDDFQDRAGKRSWWALFGDRAGQRAAELSRTMGRLYESDEDMGVPHHDRVARERVSPRSRSSGTRQERRPEPSQRSCRAEHDAGAGRRVRSASRRAQEVARPVEHRHIRDGRLQALRRSEPVALRRPPFGRRSLLLSRESSTALGDESRILLWTRCGRLG